MDKKIAWKNVKKSNSTIKEIMVEQKEELKLWEKVTPIIKTIHGEYDKDDSIVSIILCVINKSSEITGLIMDYLNGKEINTCTICNKPGLPQHIINLLDYRSVCLEHIEKISDVNSSLRTYNFDASKTILDYPRPFIEHYECPFAESCVIFNHRLHLIDDSIIKENKELIDYHNNNFFHKGIIGDNACCQNYVNCKNKECLLEHILSPDILSYSFHRIKSVFIHMFPYCIQDQLHDIAETYSSNILYSIQETFVVLKWLSETRLNNYYNIIWESDDE
jgi:hypothetical protein